MKAHLPLALVIAGGLAACGMFTKKDPSQSELGHGCQIVKCTCEKPREGLLAGLSKPETGEVLWRQDGTAYCPEGMRLENPTKSSIYDRPLY